MAGLPARHNLAGGSGRVVQLDRVQRARRHRHELPGQLLDQVAHQGLMTDDHHVAVVPGHGLDRGPRNAGVLDGHQLVEDFDRHGLVLLVDQELGRLVRAGEWAGEHDARPPAGDAQAPPQIAGGGDAFGSEFAARVAVRTRRLRMRVADQIETADHQGVTTLSQPPSQETQNPRGAARC